MNRAKFYEAIRPLLGKLSQVQVDRIEAVLEGLEDRAVTLRHAAYVLATGHHESDQWKTLEEYASGRAYEGRADLGNTVKGDGVRFKGRGLVQITGRRNYSDWSERLGVDFVGNPKRVSELRYAVPILIDGMRLGTFTGRKLSDFSDYPDMRRVVNGLDKAAMIAGHARKYEAALQAALYGAPTRPAEPQVAPQAPTTPKTTTRTVARPARGVAAALAALITALIAAGWVGVDELKTMLGF